MYNNNFVQLNIDVNRLASLGFSQTEIGILQNIYQCGGKFTSQALQQYGFNFEQAKRIMYMYNICIGKVRVESEEDTVKHLKKMFRSDYKITIHDLDVSKITSIPRVAVVANIKQEPFTIYNSNNYRGNDRLYNVVDVTTTNIIVETKRKPQLKYKADKGVKNCLEIKGIKTDGKVVVAFNKNYCRLCNRYAIIATLKRPEFYLAMYEMICFEGTKVYVYANNIGTRDVVRYNSNSQRIYDYGISPNDIDSKTKNAAFRIYKKLNGVSSTFIRGNSSFSLLEVSRPTEEYEIE